MVMEDMAISSGLLRLISSEIEQEGDRNKGSAVNSFEETWSQSSVSE